MEITKISITLKPETIEALVAVFGGEAKIENIVEAMIEGRVVLMQTRGRVEGKKLE